MAQNSEINTKLDQILDKMNSLEMKMDTRITKLEDQCAVLEKKSIRQDKAQKYVSSEVSKLKARLNVMEQDKLINNILIRGINEIEDDNDDLDNMIDTLMSKIHKNFQSSEVISSRRIGWKKSDSPRLILVVMDNADSKLRIMKNLSGNSLDNSQFITKNKVWGQKTQKIFLSDHLTQFSNNIFYEARHLRKNHKVKYAWSKLGKIYVKKDDDSLAIHVTSPENLSNLRSIFSYEDEESSYCETDNAATETETDATQKSKPSGRGKRKLNRTHSDPSTALAQKSPHPKRTRAVIAKITK